MFGNAGLAKLIGGEVPSAAAIGAAVPQPAAFTQAGTRLVDTLATSASQVVTVPGAWPGQIDMSEAMSFTLALTPTLQAPIVGAQTFLVTLTWLDPLGTVPVNRTYEVNAGDNTSAIVTTIQDRALGSSVGITLAAVTPGVASVNVQISTSSRPCDRPRIYEVPNNVPGSYGTQDGQLGFLTATLGPSASSPVRLFGLAVGRVMLRLAAQTNTVAWKIGFGFGQAYNFKPANLAAGAETLTELLVPSRPLSIVATNTSGAGNATYFAMAWCDPDGN